MENLLKKMESSCNASYIFFQTNDLKDKKKTFAFNSPYYLFNENLRKKANVSVGFVEEIIKAHNYSLYLKHKERLKQIDERIIQTFKPQTLEHLNEREHKLYGLRDSTFLERVVLFDNCRSSRGRNSNIYLAKWVGNSLLTAIVLFRKALEGVSEKNWEDKVIYKELKNILNSLINYCLASNSTYLLKHFAAFKLFMLLNENLELEISNPDTETFTKIVFNHFIVGTKKEEMFQEVMDNCPNYFTASLRQITEKMDLSALENFFL